MSYLTSMTSYFPYISTDISMDIPMDIHEKSVDRDADVDGKFHIHGKPACNLSFVTSTTSDFLKLFLCISLPRVKMSRLQDLFVAYLH